jgi:thiol-disulfide isomerase/thioredoxin
LIKGSFNNYEGVIYLEHNDMKDSCIVKDGIFEFKGEIDLPIPAVLFINHSDARFFILEPGELAVNVDTIAKIHNGKSVCMSNTNVLKGGTTNTLLKSFDNIIENKSGAMQGKTVAEKKQVYSGELRGFLVEHPRDIASLILIDNASRLFSQQELVSFYENFDERLRNGYYGKSLKATIDKNNMSIVGTAIKEFTQADLNGKPISISSLRGRYVLIDFWASWCIPCRKENPNFLKVYEKYKLKGFEVLGISIDNDRASWSNAVQQDNLNWLNVSDLKGRKNDVAVMFDIGAIPDNILIDREGKIIAKRISSQELEQLLAKAL